MLGNSMSTHVPATRGPSGNTPCGNSQMMLCGSVFGGSTLKMKEKSKYWRHVLNTHRSKNHCQCGFTGQNALENSKITHVHTAVDRK